MYRFSGKELDQETGLSYFGARYYDPKYSFWLSVDPLAEKFPNVGAYNYCLGNPVNLVDPDGRAATPPDDHFDLKGNFLYTDKRLTNNIVIHTSVFNFLQGNDEVQLKDYKFNAFTYPTLSKIGEHYAKNASVDMSKLRNCKFSVGDFYDIVNKGSYREGQLGSFNDGEYDTESTDGSSTVMFTHGNRVTFNLENGKIDPELNDKYNLISILDHEGGKIGHLMNPDKKHSDIYKDQINKYKNVVTPDCLKSLMDNLKKYENEEKN